MSAICGIYSPRRPDLADREILERMLRSLGRAPASSVCRFVEAAAGLALGHVYVPSFLAAGEKPAPAWLQDETLVVAVDGHVFKTNGQELSPGEGTSEAGAVAGLLRDSGEEFPRGLEGHCSFAVWQRDQRRLQIATDPLGCRPLYVCHDAARGLTVFATELRALLQHPSLKPQPDAAAVAAYLGRGTVPAPFSILAGVAKLMPAEVLSFDASGGRSSRTYWRLPPASKGVGGLEDWAQPTRTQLTRSVSRLTRGAGNVAVFLSSGVDSATALAALVNSGNRDCAAFTLSFQGNAASRLDSGWAADIAAEMGVPHFAVPIGSVEPATFVETVKQFDEPTNSDRAISQLLLNQAARAQGFDSAINGHQSEQLFGTTSWQKRLSLGRPLEPEGGEGELRRRACTPDIVKAGELAKLLPQTGDYAGLLGHSFDRLREIVPYDTYYDCSHALTFMRIALGATGFDNVAVGPLTGVEARSAYRDMELFLFSRSLPNALKGSEEPQMRRAVLKAAFADLFPSLAVERPKLPLPPTPWLQEAFPQLRAVVLRSMDRLKRSGLVNARRVDRLLQKLDERVAVEAELPSVVRKVWLLFALQTWFDTYVLREDPAGYLL